jgi:hypothetical protein
MYWNDFWGLVAGFGVLAIIMLIVAVFVLA